MSRHDQAGPAGYRSPPCSCAPGSRRRGRCVGAGPDPKCPLSALKKASKPVEITFWHSMPRENETTLQALTEQSQSTRHSPM